MRGYARPDWTPEMIERFKQCWNRQHRTLAKIVGREMRMTEGAARAAYYRFIVRGEEPSPSRRKQAKVETHVQACPPEPAQPRG